MNGMLRTLAPLALACLPAAAQQPALPDPLLDDMTGKWVLQGTIARQTTTHDIDAGWVLNHGYVRFHEISREKDAKGVAAYEAIVFVGWDQAKREYACLWLDSTAGGGLSAQGIGRGQKNGDEITFVFHDQDGTSVHTTFAYDKNADSWRWLIDNEEGAKSRPFARVRLTRK